MTARLYVSLTEHGWRGELRRGDSLRFQVGGATRDEVLTYAAANAGEPFEVVDDPAGDAVAGITWWNGLAEAERRHWLDAAGSAVVADAWAVWKRAGRPDD